MKTMAILVAIVLMQASSLAGTWLKPESLFAVSEKDLDAVLKMLVVDKDTEAAAQMMAEGKVMESASKRQAIIQTNLGFESGLSGTIEFRFRGKTQKFWTTSEYIENDEK
jgi:hypothetical protein